MTDSIKIKALLSTPGFRVGEEYVVATDKEGNPLDIGWRRRLHNAKIDNSFEVAIDTKPIETKTTKRSVEETK